MKKPQLNRAHCTDLDHMLTLERLDAATERLDILGLLRWRLRPDQNRLLL